MNILLWILVIVIGYLLGGINGALLMSRLVKHDDVRNHGSGNAGLTNYFRTYGGFQTLLVIVIDVAKCVAACQIAALLLPEQALNAKMVAGVAVILGHSYPVFAHFRGGKGILCGAALAGCIDWRILVLILSVFFITVAITRFVSLGSILATTAFLICFLVGYHDSLLICLLAAATWAFVVWRHRANIKRLVEGTESKLSFHKKKG